jgi:hypothetical protein
LSPIRIQRSTEARKPVVSEAGFAVAQWCAVEAGVGVGAGQFADAIGKEPPAARSTRDRFEPTLPLGTWRHLRARNYTAVDRFFVFKADGSFAGTQETTRDIELGANADEYTGTATSAFFNPADQLVSPGCATSTATRLE